MVKFKVDVYANGVVKYAAGHEYPATSETLFYVVRGDAERAAAATEEPAAAAEVRAKRRGR